MSNQNKVQVNDAEGGGGSFIANSKAPKPTTDKKENPGLITSDSLAAESLDSSGSFASGNATADSVPSKSTTSNTTDTSAARTIEPAANRGARDDGVEAESASHSSGGAGGDEGVSVTALGSSAGGGVTISGGGGSDSSSGTTKPTSTSTSSTSGGSTSNENDKPKGKNITEGGFDSSAPNASFNDEIGTKEDPGREAERSFEASNAAAGASGGYEGANDQTIKGGQGGFENLKETSA